MRCQHERIWTVTRGPNFLCLFFSLACISMFRYALRGKPLLSLYSTTTEIVQNMNFYARGFVILMLPTSMSPSTSMPPCRRRQGCFLMLMGFPLMPVVSPSMLSVFVVMLSCVFFMLPSLSLCSMGQVGRGGWVADVFEKITLRNKT